MRPARASDPDGVREQLYLVRAYRSDDMPSLLVHMGDLVCNFDMLLVSAKGLAGGGSPRFHPDLCRRQLREAQYFLKLLRARMDDAQAIADTWPRRDVWSELAAEGDNEQEDGVDD